MTPCSWRFHPDPGHARCDGPNSLPLDQVLPLWRILKRCIGWSGSRKDLRWGAVGKFPPLEKGNGNLRIFKHQ